MWVFIKNKKILKHKTHRVTDNLQLVKTPHRKSIRIWETTVDTQNLEAVENSLN